jgi:hypothetical protein
MVIIDLAQFIPLLFPIQTSMSISIFSISERTHIVADF